MNLEEIEKPEVPGMHTYPEYTLVCQECEAELVVSVPESELEQQVCGSCGASSFKIQCISYPLDGPGFQEGYDPRSIIFGGGPGCSAESLEEKLDFD